MLRCKTTTLSLSFSLFLSPSLSLSLFLSLSLSAQVSNAEEKKKLLQDGSVFQGSLKEGRPHGFGTVTYAGEGERERETEGV